MEENELFEKAPVPRAFFSLALPVVMGHVVSLCYNMTDTWFIARTGNTDLVAGISLCAPVFTAMVALGDVLGLGGSTFISRLFGQKKDEDGRRISVFSFYGSFLMGVVVAALLLIFRTPILSVFGADQDTLPFASSYYTFIAAGAPIIILSFTPLNQLRTEGLARVSMTGSIIGTVVNIILDPILIFLAGMGAAGAACATVIGYVCTDLYYIWALLKRAKKISINPRGFHISGAEIREVLSIGIPASVANFMQSIAIALTNRSLLVYGNDKVAAMGIVNKVNMIALMILIAFAFGTQPLTGYNYGAKNYKRLRSILKFSYLFECGLGLAFTIVLSAAARPILYLLMPDAEIVALGVPMLRRLQISMVFVGAVLVTTCLFQAAGKAMGALWMSISRQGLIFAVVLFIASNVGGYAGILVSQPISDLLTAILALILFNRYIGKELFNGQRLE